MTVYKKSPAFQRKRKPAFRTFLRKSASGVAPNSHLDFASTIFMAHHPKNIYILTS